MNHPEWDSKISEFQLDLKWQFQIVFWRRQRRQRHDGVSAAASITLEETHWHKCRYLFLGQLRLN